MNTNSRFWASPLAFGVFLFSIITGVLIFITLLADISLSTSVWLISLFVMAVVCHTVVNWKQFT